jgi:hypothetical protein
MGADRYRAVDVDFAGWTLWISEAVKTMILIRRPEKYWFRNC